VALTMGRLDTGLRRSKVDQRAETEQDTPESFRIEVPRATVSGVFSYLLVLPDGEPNDPACLVSMIPNFSVDEIITLGGGERLRILEITTDVDELLLARGMRAVFTVEPADD